MTPFIHGFSDELEKLAIVGAVAKGGAGIGKAILKRPLHALGALFVGGAAVEGAKQARRASRVRKSIRPSRSYYTDYYRALGIPRGRMTKRQRQRIFAHARAVPGRYKR